MAIDAPSSTFFSPWPDRLRHSAIILLAAGLALAVLVAFGELSLARAAAVFICIAAAALVPWRLHDAATSREDVRGVNPVESAAVSAVVAGMPDPAVLLDRAGRVLHLNAAAAQLAPALRRNELAQFALRSPEIITALREAIATTEPRRATYLDQVPVDRWMELIITPVPVPTLFGGAEKCMLMTFHDLLSLPRVELSAHVRPDACVDIVPIIRQVADGLEPLAGERQVAIEIDLPETPVTIAGDREELLRLFENLIENALKYGASGGRVIVSLTQAASSEGAPEVRIVVRDFGPGIAPEHLPRLTERFYRVDVGDSRAQGGTGLGLSLVKHILNRHRGRLLIESVPKNGATFTACFPQPKPPASV